MTEELKEAVNRGQTRRRTRTRTRGKAREDSRSSSCLSCFLFPFFFWSFFFFLLQKNKNTRGKNEIKKQKNQRKNQKQNKDEKNQRTKENNTTREKIKEEQDEEEAKKKKTSKKKKKAARQGAVRAVWNNAGKRAKPQVPCNLWEKISYLLRKKSVAFHSRLEVRRLEVRRIDFFLYDRVAGKDVCSFLAPAGKWQSYNCICWQVQLEGNRATAICNSRFFGSRPSWKGKHTATWELVVSACWHNSVGGAKEKTRNDREKKMQYDCGELQTSVQSFGKEAVELERWEWRRAAEKCRRRATATFGVL